MSDKHKQHGAHDTTASTDSNEVKALKAQLTEKEAQLSAALAAKAPSRYDNEAKAVAVAKRATLKAQTKKNETHAFYAIPESGEPFYRQGEYYPAGSIVKLPLAEDPSMNWEPVEDLPESKLAAKSQTPAGRAADKDL